jgi:hypothetical protein
VEVLSLGGDISYSIQKNVSTDFLLVVTTKWAVVELVEIVGVFPDKVI